MRKQITQLKVLKFYACCFFLRTSYLLSFTAFLEYVKAYTPIREAADLQKMYCSIQLEYTIIITITMLDTSKIIISRIPK